MSAKNPKFDSALKRIASARPGVGKNDVLVDVMKDPEIREFLRTSVDPNEQTKLKPLELRGIGVVTLNRAYAGLAKPLHIAEPVSYPVAQLPLVLTPRESWMMFDLPGGARALVDTHGIVRGQYGFMCKLSGKWPKAILDGILVLPDAADLTEYYKRVKTSETGNAYFVAIDVANENSPFSERMKFLIDKNVRRVNFRAVPEDVSQFAMANVAFRRVDANYAIGRDDGFVIGAVRKPR